MSIMRDAMGMIRRAWRGLSDAAGNVCRAVAARAEKRESRQPVRDETRYGRYVPPHGPPQSTTYGDARFADVGRDAERLREMLGGGRGIWFGQEALAEYSTVPRGSLRDFDYIGDRHLLTVAPTSSGKGACAIIPNLLLQNDLSIICIDPKGQAAAVTKRMRGLAGKKVHLLNPFNEHGLGTSRYNPLRELRITSPDVVKQVGRLAEALILTEGREPYFDNTGRDLVKVLMLHLIEKRGPGATLPEMRKLLTRLSQADDQAAELLDELAKSPHPFIAQPAARFRRESRDIVGAVNSAITQTGFLDDPQIAHVLSASDFSMQDFKDRPTTLYVILPAADVLHYSRFFRLIVVSAVDHLMSRPGGTRTLVMLDEFAQLGRLDMIQNAIAQARGYNVQLWPFVQDLNQLQDIYGKRWQSFVANAGVVQWFTPNDIFTAEYLSKLIGKTTVQTFQSNSSTSFGESHSKSGMSSSGNRTNSTSQGEAGVDFLSPQDLFNIPSAFQILTHAGLKYPILCTREPYYRWSGPLGEIAKDLADPDPFHLAQDSAPLTVGMPAVFPATAETPEPGTVVCEPGYALELFISGDHPEAEAAGWKTVHWVEPLRVRRGNVDCPAAIERAAAILVQNGQKRFLARTLAEDRTMVVVSMPHAELRGFEIKQVKELRIPGEYRVFSGQRLLDQDYVICAVGKKFLWPVAMTTANLEEVERLRVKLSEELLG